MTGDAAPRLAWEDVLPAAQEAFSVWTHGRELKWAQVAWGHLTVAGLTAYRSDVERCRVAIKLFALAQIYLDWCSLTDDESQEDDLSSWAWELDIGAFRVGQLVGGHDDIEGDDDEELRRDALEWLTEKERYKVRDAVLTGFGGDNSLFLSLWRINHPTPVSKPAKPAIASVQPVFTGSLFPDETPSLFAPDENEEELEDEEALEKDDEDDEDDWQVMNCPTEDKLAAYEWIADGCPSVR